MTRIEVTILVIGIVSSLASIVTSIAILSRRRYEKYAKKQLEHNEQKRRVRKVLQKGKVDE